jgi:hypothetical protein
MFTVISLVFSSECMVGDDYLFLDNLTIRMCKTNWESKSFHRVTMRFDFVGK